MSTTVASSRLLSQVMDKLGMAISSLDFQLHLVNDLSEEMLAYKARDYINTTAIPVQELRFLLDNLRVLQALEHDDILINPQNESMKSLVNDAKKRVAPFFQHLGHTLVVNYNGHETDYIRVDSNYMTRALANLFFYALRYNSTEIKDVYVDITGMSAGSIAVTVAFERQISAQNLEDLELQICQKILSKSGGSLCIEKGDTGSQLKLILT